MKELMPSSFPLTCSIMHSNRTKNPPKDAKPLPVPQMRLQSFLSTMAVDLLTLPISIYLISTAFMNMAIISPIAPPITYDIPALIKQFLSIGLEISEYEFWYCMDY